MSEPIRIKLRDYWRGYSDVHLELARDHYRCAKRLPPGIIVPMPTKVFKALMALARDGQLE